MVNICSECYSDQNVHRSRKTGIWRCDNCRLKKRYHDVSTYENCSLCERSRPVAHRTRKGKPLCQRCYNNKRSLRKKKNCHNCGKKRCLVEQSGNSLCRTCFRMMSYVCSMCNGTENVHKRHKAGVLLCDKCFYKRVCKGCDNERQIASAGLCFGCYKKMRRRIKVLDKSK